MSLITRLLAWRYRLPRARTYQVFADRGVKVPMPDGAVLLADRYGEPGAPVILVRTPYGRAGAFSVIPTLFAERGFQVFVQSTRGTFGSDGQFTPFVHERSDGLATIDWLVKQPWYGGKLATWGPSYLGFTQWAVADAPEIKAMSLQVTAASFEDHFYLGGAFALGDALSWAVSTTLQERPLNALRSAITRRRLEKMYGELPLGDLDGMTVGHPIPHYQNWLDRDPAYWAAIDHRTIPAAPVQTITGWYDLFLPEQLRDYADMKAAGRQPYLTIGPWSHGAPLMEAMMIMLGESLRWFRAHLLDEPRALREQPVRINVTGGGGWRDLPEWPPPSTARRWHPAPGGRLSEQPGDTSDRYRYDPADPTPSLGGPTLYDKGLPVDNRPLEARPDVLVYTGEPLARDLEVIGEVRAELRVRSSLAHTDFFVRLCDVDPSGVSTNVTEGIVRLDDHQEEVTIRLRAAAHRFRRGHRLRFQISSGAHPHVARNTGTGEPLATAGRLAVAEQEVLHGSCFVIPEAS
ncbi:CocE/NonD family hydrolase [Nonomuraea sediminis]|uniref:CocE/NonD family hydrolase n=1 Tax=Nonomuraea sediminis TaxID=2835864 RepID=UPI001BDCBABA|nr:CocE/NonD family hydrolase [Nonomuraea sediminis]